jgi:hypothetical protein
VTTRASDGLRLPWHLRRPCSSLLRRTTWNRGHRVQCVLPIGVLQQWNVCLHFLCSRWAREEPIPRLSHTKSLHNTAVSCEEQTNPAPVQAMEMYEGGREGGGVAPRIIDRGTFTPWNRTSSNHGIRSWVGLDILEKKRYMRLLGIEPRSTCRPACSLHTSVTELFRLLSYERRSHNCFSPLLPLKQRTIPTERP